MANLLNLNFALRDSGKRTEAEAVATRLLRAFPDNPQVQRVTAEAIGKIP